MTRQSLGAGGRAIKAHGNATVGITSVLLRAANQNRNSLVIQNLGPGSLYIGTVSVSTANAPQIAPGGSLALDQSEDDVFTVASLAGTDVRFFEELNG